MIFGKIIKNQRSLFWVLQVVGWLVWGTVVKFGLTLAMFKEVAPNYFLYVMLISAIALVITLGMRLIYRYLWGRAAWIQALGFIGACSGGAFLWLRARSYIFYGWIEPDKDMEAWNEKMGHDAAELYANFSYLESFFSSATIMVAWSVLYFAIKYYQIFQEVQKSALKSAAMAHEAQLKMLRYQLNPHFLFNTLNAISTLVLEQQTELANRMVTKLSSFLRYSLDNDPMQKITLKQELAALKLYLDIEKVRFEERLTLELDIGEQASQALIPSLLLQPLVENAIKYGIAQAEEGGQLRIAARVFAGDLLLELSDDGPGVELVEGQIPDANGVGVRNTRERLVELYGNQHSFRLSKTEPHGLTVNIRIPFDSE